jgi:uncharacterized protein
VGTRIPFNDISPTGNYYEVQDIEGLAAQQDFVVKGHLEARCTLRRKGEAKVEMQGRLQANLSLTCDRCLAAYDANVDAEMQILFETASSDTWQVKELECNFQDLDCITLDEPVVDLDDILRQQLYLLLPLKKLCSEQCKGICPRCGVNLNLEECRCANVRQDLPFAVLAQLKKKNTTEK